MVNHYGCKNGLNGGLSVVGEVFPSISSGSGVPVHSAPLGTVYVDMSATVGTTSHYRNTSGTATWAAMSDD